jgi:hypothetical protein
MDSALTELVKDLRRCANDSDYDGADAMTKAADVIEGMMEASEQAVTHNEIGVSSIYGMKSGKGLVCITWERQKAQLTPDEARAHGRKILEASEAAETDGFLIAFLTEKTGLPLEAAARILVEFRRHRERSRSSSTPAM